MEETDEIRRAQRGDKDAASRLFARHWGTIHAFVLGQIGDRDRAEDLTQQAFLRAWAKLPQLRQPDRFLPWLRRVARTVVLNGRRGPDLRPAPRSEVPDPVEVAASTEDRACVDAALSQLSKGDRTLLLLVHLEELSLASVSRLLEVPPTTLRRRLARATERFERAYLAVRGGNHVRH